LQADQYILDTVVADLDGSNLRKASIKCSLQDAVVEARALAKSFLLRE